ncbi:hypothetical protein BC830DRAFT_1130548 [Chytriomyces sp. MP71]|nr:hypothetical protein BC830DRAFT_1130548 [Chytriomyces sp. MP71]
MKLPTTFLLAFQATPCSQNTNLTKQVVKTPLNALDSSVVMQETRSTAERRGPFQCTTKLHDDFFSRMKASASSYSNLDVCKAASFKSTDTLRNAVVVVAACLSAPPRVAGKVVGVAGTGQMTGFLSARWTCSPCCQSLTPEEYPTGRLVPLDRGKALKR